MKNNFLLACLLVAACTTPDADVPNSNPPFAGLINATPGEQAFASEEMDLIPQDIFEQMLSGDGLVGNFGLAWQQDVVVVSFYGGSDEVLSLIEKTANEWVSTSNSLRFAFRDANGDFNRWHPADRVSNGDIRISFDRSGYWSTVGRLGLNVEPGNPTMNLANLDRKLLRYMSPSMSTQWPTSYERNVILHEFGHAIGISHEHFHPACQGTLDLDKIVANLMRTQNWSERQAKFNVDAEVYFSEMQRFIEENFPNTDPSFSISPSTDNGSVMLYDFEPRFYESGSPCVPAEASGFAHGLSDDDMAAANAMYPRR